MSRAMEIMEKVGQLEVAALLERIPLTVLPFTGETCYAIPSGHVAVGALFPWRMKPWDPPIHFGVVRHSGEFLPTDIASQLPIRVKLGTNMDFVSGPAASESTFTINVMGFPWGKLGEVYPMDVLVPTRALRPMLKTLRAQAQQALSQERAKQEALPT